MLRQALGLLERTTEPTIADYEGPEPATRAGEEPLACPINLTPPPDGSVRRALADEVARLRPWAEESRRARGRTLFGASGAAPDQVDAVVAALADIAESGDVSAPPAGPVEWRFGMPLLVRHLADDLRTLYHEAIAAQPGPDPSHDELNDWIFGGSALGKVLLEIAAHLDAADDDMCRLVRGLLVPEGRLGDGSATFSGVAGHEAE